MLYDLIAHLLVLIVAVPVLASAAWIAARALIQCARIERERRARNQTRNQKR